MEKIEIQNQCQACGYKAGIPGDDHISCLFDWGKSWWVMPNGEAHGIAHGWYVFPFNYDPIWMREECMAFSKEADPGKKLQNDPFVSLLAILGRRLRK